MDLENLIKKAASGIATITLAASLTGCASREMSSNESIIAGEALIDFSGTNVGRKIGSLLYSLGTRERQMEIEKIRTQVNLNVQNSQGGQYNQQGLPENVVHANGEYYPAPGYKWVNPNDSNLIVEKSLHIFVANGWRDYNGDGFTEFPSEFPGYGRNEFYDTEEIVFVMHDKGGDGIKRVLSYDIYNPQGEVSRSHSMETSYGAHIVGNLMENLLSKGGYGTHSISYKMNGFYIGSADVTILPTKKNDKNE